jgi:hypothetical protein
MLLSRPLIAEDKVIFLDVNSKSYAEIQKIICEPSFLKNLLDTFSKAEELMTLYNSVCEDKDSIDWIYINSIAKE